MLYTGARAGRRDLPFDACDGRAGAAARAARRGWRRRHRRRGGAGHTQPAAAPPRPGPRAAATTRRRGSTLSLEQSVTTQTTDVGDTPQSYVPLYELWLSFRPCWWFDSHFSVRARFDYTKELTNDQTTTLYRQDVLGDVWTDGDYATRLDSLWDGTRGEVGLRVLWPTSLGSQAAGTYFTAGPRGSADHRFDLAGPDVRWWSDLTVSLGVNYLHAFSQSTTPTDYGTFSYTRQNADGVSFLSDQVSGQPVVRDEIQVLLRAALQVTPALTVSLFGVVFNDWHDQATPLSVATATGMVTPGTGTPVSATDQPFSVQTWFVAGVDYDVLDELTLSAGYYNLANAIAPDGATRGLFGSATIWWSPDARFTFTATANLDALYDDVSARPQPAPQSARAAR